MNFSNKIIKKIIILFFIITIQLPFSPLFATEKDVSNTYILKESIIVKNISDELARNIILEVPLMAEIDSNYQNLISTNYSLEPVSINKHTNGNRTAIFHLSGIESQETIPIIITFMTHTKLTDINWGIMESKCIPEHKWAYLNPEPKIESDSPLVKNTLKKIFPKATVDSSEEIILLAKAAYKYTQDSLNYSLNGPAVNQGALAALGYGEGSCVEYASLFTALCRAGGIQARIVNGFASDIHTLGIGNLKSSLNKARHQWAEFYLPERGWIPVDPTLAKPGQERFGSLPVGYYLIQNYGDLPVKASYQGGQLNISFDYKVKLTSGGVLTPSEV